MSSERKNAVGILGSFYHMARWAWLSRGMADKEDIVAMNPGEGLTVDELNEEMKWCEEATGSSDAFHASLDEVYQRPPVSRTTFLWQIDMESCGPTLEEEVSWETPHERWAYLPGHWQSILNSRLAEYHAKVQDSEALYLHRLDTYGETDVKTRNAKVKHENLQAGINTSSAILMMKGTQKEASKDVYSRSVQFNKGVLTVKASNKVLAYRFDVKDMTLVTLEDPPVKRQLRIVSVTGRNHDIQEIRVHLDALSLHTSSALDGFDGVPPPAQKCSAPGTAEAAEVDGELALMDMEEEQFEKAEDALAANTACSEVADPTNEAVVEPADEAMADQEDGGKAEVSSDEEVTWDLSGDSVFIVGLENGEKPKNDDETKPSCSKQIPSQRFNQMESFLFLEKFDLTRLPDIDGAGIGVHTTTCVWQVRYPGDGKQSCARSYGDLKTKGYVPPCRALLQCLLWSWKQHGLKHGSCDLVKERIQKLTGALNLDLGHHIPI